MGDLVKTIFGGTDDSAQKAQTRANARSQEFIEQQTGLARGEAKQLFDRSQRQSAEGIQQAIGAVRAGNVEAQDRLRFGAQQAQSAILGLPVATGPQTSFVIPQNFQLPGALQGIQAPQVFGLDQFRQQTPQIAGELQPPQQDILSPTENINRLALGLRGFS